MEDFTVGEEVVVVDDKGFTRGDGMKLMVSPIKNGETYIVLGVRMICAEHKVVAIDIGMKNPGGTKCSGCKSLSGDEIFWMNTWRFAKKQRIESKNEFQEVAYTQIRKKMPLSSVN